MDFKVPTGEDTIRFVLVDENRGPDEDMLGEVTLPLAHVGLGRTMHTTFEVEASVGCDDACGDLEVVVVWEARDDAEARLKVPFGAVDANVDLVIPLGLGI